MNLISSEAVQPNLPENQRFWDPIVEPERGFATLVDRPHVIIPSFLIIVCTILMALGMQFSVGWNEVAASLRGDGASASLPASITQPSVVAAGVYLSFITTIFGALFLALILYAVLRFVWGEPRHSLFAVVSCVLYGFLPLQFRKVLIGAILLLCKVDYDPDQPIASSLAFLVSKTVHPVLWSMLGSLDVFTIWSVILLAIACKQLSGIRSNLAYLPIPILFVFWVAANAALAALAA
jgi:hypothetical protein